MIRRSSASAAAHGAPRIGERPLAFDCELYRAIERGRHLMVLGRLLAMEIHDGCLPDAERT
jgi:flavin reductase (DIM6/NTAB) family NADH-FMN oxidoreductase RutF